MHTDAGNSSAGSGQALLLTALVYLNADWADGDGGELRVWPYPYAAEAIAPLEGRLVLFEPRLVHEVLPNWKKRFCFTLWCHAEAHTASRQVDHASLDAITLEPCLELAGAIGEAWRRRNCIELPYTPAMPPLLRPFFLSEMRGWLVRTAARAEELDAVARSHEGTERDEMLAGISAHHESVRLDNPLWISELIAQLPSTRPSGGGGGVTSGTRVVTEAEAEAGASLVRDEGGPTVELPELQALVHLSCPWWL